MCKLHMLQAYEGIAINTGYLSFLYKEYKGFIEFNNSPYTDWICKFLGVTFYVKNDIPDNYFRVLIKDGDNSCWSLDISDEYIGKIDKVLKLKMFI